MNCICLISIGKNYLLQYSLPSIEQYCKKYNIALTVIDKAFYNLPKRDNYNYLTFEKFQVYNLFNDFDWVLRLDADIIIKPDCPDIFKNKNPNLVYAVREDIGERQKNRLGQIKAIKKDFGAIPWKNNYINSGVVLSHHKTKKIYKLTNDDLEKIHSRSLGYFKEQNLLNWKINNLNYQVIDLGYKYNYLKAYQDEGYSKNNAYIIHYAGKQSVKEENMRKDFNKWFKKINTIQT